MTPQTLLELRDRPHEAATQAMTKRRAAHGERVWIRATAAHDPVAVAARLGTDDHFAPLPAWPLASDWRTGDRLVLRVDPEHAEPFAQYLVDALGRAPLPADCSVAVFSSTPSGLHPLWCLAAARIVLPASVRIEVRHDLVGIRLTQVALAFGPDTLSGPVEVDRTLPLAGVTRPSETTRAGLHTLVRQAGLIPTDSPATP